MKAVSPVFPISEPLEHMYIGPESTTQLPTFNTEKCIITRWELSDDERQHIAQGGDLFIAIANHTRPIWPFLPLAMKPEEALSIVMELEIKL